MLICFIRTFTSHEVWSQCWCFSIRTASINSLLTVHLHFVTALFVWALSEGLAIITAAVQSLFTERQLLTG